MNFVNRYGKCRCDCLKYCKGGKTVCYETYRRHEPYRRAAQDAAIQRVLQEVGPLTMTNNFRASKEKMVRILLDVYSNFKLRSLSASNREISCPHRAVITTRGEC